MYVLGTVGKYAGPTPEQAALANGLKGAIVQDEDTVVISKGDAEKTFIISDKPETAVARALEWRSVGKAIAGIVLVVVMTVSLIAHAGILAPRFGVPWLALFNAAQCISDAFHQGG